MTTKQRPRSLRRLVILGVLVTFCAVILAPTVRAYIHQRSQISSLQEQITQQRSTVKDLQQEKQDWQDPKYVEAQARERLKFVMPGDTSYTTIDGDEHAKASRPESGIAAVPDKVRSSRPWYGEVWESFVIADSGDASPASSTAQSPKDTTPEPPPVRDTQGKK